MKDETIRIDAAGLNRASQERAKRRRRRRRRQRVAAFITLLLLCAAVIGFVFFIGTKVKSGEGIQTLFKKTEKGMKEPPKMTELPLEQQTEDQTEEEKRNGEESENEQQTEEQDEDPEVESAAVEEVLAQAELQAQMYDYDRAIKILKKSDAYSTSEELKQKVKEYKKMKEACVAIPPEDVTHIFYHSLVVEPEKGFVPGTPGYDGWQQWMTTVYEFDRITQSMYDRGYVLVSIHDLIKKSTDEEGMVTVEPQNIYLPEGKKPFVLSLDDLCYYHTYDDHGVASRLVLDEEGKPTCEYIQEDGNVVLGDYDVVPRMDTFLEEHPDGCYRGARGIIALTGYDGVLGYRTDGSYSEENNENTDVYYADELQLAWLEEHPDYDFDQEVADAKKVADAMKAEGWEFASHTWGHKNIGATEYDDLVRDTERWMKYVSPIVGEVDSIIFAHGADIAVGEYSEEDDKYVYLKNQGFDIFCNVDSTPYTTNVYKYYLHQGRRNLDGYRIYNDSIDPDAITDDLFLATDVLDPDRPLPVPDL